jgi:hypothetical protein
MTASKVKQSTPDYRLHRRFHSGRETTHGNGPIVIPGHAVKEVTICNIAAEPAFRAEIPDGGCIIVELRD